MHDESPLLFANVTRPPGVVAEAVPIVAMEQPASGAVKA
jgi:hypothetical protein